MPRLMRAAIVTLFLSATVVGCGQHDAEWKALPDEQDTAYHVFVKTYKDGAYADQPFSIKITSKTEPEKESEPISAEQCKNVRLIQSKNTIYVFYDELILHGFSSMRYDRSLPRPFLCDMQQPVCRELLKVLAADNRTVSSVCTYSG